MALGMALKFITSVAKGLKLKVRKFWRLFPMFVEVAEEKLVGGLYAPYILSRVKKSKLFNEQFSKQCSLKQNRSTIPSVFTPITNKRIPLRV